MLPTSPPPPPDSRSQPSCEDSLIADYLVKYVIKLIEHLCPQDSRGSLHQGKFQLLLVTEHTPNTRHFIQSFEDALHDTYNLQTYNLQTEVTPLTLNELTHRSFDKRYDLGVIIHPQLLSSTDSKGNLSQAHSSSQDHSVTLRSAATKLRDLFSEQSVIFADSTDQYLAFNDLGYTFSGSDQVNGRTINCWQFNLYDYKKQPDWLNAKYWANPENFDKYRW